MNEDFIFSEDNEKTVKQSANFVVTEKTVKVKAACAFKIPKDNAKLLEVDMIKEQVNYLANFYVYFTDADPKKAYKVELILNAVLNLKFSSMVETTTEYIFFLNKDAYLFTENRFVESVNNASNMFYYIISGRLEKLAKKYSDLVFTLMDVMQANEITSHSGMGYEILVSELTRDKTDTSALFRYVVTKQNERNGFTTINIREVPRTQSAISALFGENIMNGITSTVLNTENGKKAILSPIEQITLNKFD